MTIFRSINALVLGFLAMTLIVIVGTVLVAAATGVTIAGGPTPVYLALNIALSPLAGAAGGWVCRRLAPVNPSRFVWVLVFLVLALALVSVLRPGPGQPGWYLWVVGPLGALGVALGGRVWKTT